MSGTPPAPMSLGAMNSTTRSASPADKKRAVDLPAAFDQQRQDAAPAQLVEQRAAATRLRVRRATARLPRRVARAAAPALRRVRVQTTSAPGRRARRVARDSLPSRMTRCGRARRRRQPRRQRRIVERARCWRRRGWRQRVAHAVRLERDASPETQRESPPRAASRPSSVTAALSVTHGRFVRDKSDRVDCWPRHSSPRTPSDLDARAPQLLDAAAGDARIRDRFMPTTTRATLAAISRSVQAACAP